MKKTATIAIFTIYSWGFLQSQNTQLSSKQLAGQLNTVTTMVPFLTITPDSRSAAMGDVGVEFGLSQPKIKLMRWFG
ncbi:MAG: hypothetical protein WCH09_05415, partial [Bacteroidota bacterium]